MFKNFLLYICIIKIRPERFLYLPVICRYLVFWTEFQARHQFPCFFIRYLLVSDPSTYIQQPYLKQSAIRSAESLFSPMECWIIRTITSAVKQIRKCARICSRVFT